MTVIINGQRVTLYPKDKKLMRSKKVRDWFLEVEKRIKKEMEKPYENNHVAS